jgi:hypothetical protein
MIRSLACWSIIPAVTSVGENKLRRLLKQLTSTLTMFQQYALKTRTGDINSLNLSGLGHGILRNREAMDKR